MPTQLSTTQLRKLTDALLACHHMRDREARNAIVEQLPEDVQSTIQRHAEDKVDVVNICRRCVSYPSGLEALLTALRFFEGESPAMLKVERLATETEIATDARFPDSQYVRNRHELLTPLPKEEESQDPHLAPFVVGAPILDARNFFGRQKEINDVTKLWTGIPLLHAMVFGPRRSGKTSLLLHLKNMLTQSGAKLRPGQRPERLSRGQPARCVFVDFRQHQNKTQVGFVRSLLQGLGLPTPPDCSLDQFQELMSEGVQSPTVVLLDEVGLALERYPEIDLDVWSTLRSLTLTTNGNLGFILALSGSSAQLIKQNGGDSPFFNIFGYVTTLGPFTELEARELIRNAPLPFPPDDVQWILTQSHYIPLLLQHLCHARLAALEEGETDDRWKQEGLEQMKPFLYLLGGV